MKKKFGITGYMSFECVPAYNIVHGNLVINTSICGAIVRIGAHFGG